MKFILLSIYFVTYTLCNLKSNSASEKNNKSGNKFTFKQFSIDPNMFLTLYKANQKSQRRHSRMHSQRGNTTVTLKSSLQGSSNNNFVVKDFNTFRTENRNFQYKIYDKQLEEIFNTLLKQSETRITPNNIKDYLHLFIKGYTLCDADGSNVLELEEFQKCMKSDPSLSQITPPPVQYSTSYNYTDATKFYEKIFSLLDDRFDGYVNFVGYMRLRLLAFSWRQCSMFGPFIEEIDFECALEVSLGFRTVSRDTSRNLYKTAMTLSSDNKLPNMDFITYVILTNSISLFGKINSNEVNDITRSEFNLALDDNTLPSRYNQDIVDNMFQLVEEQDRSNQGIDLHTFYFYDYMLQLFYLGNNTRPYHLNYEEFSKVVQNPLFPNQTLKEIYMIPPYVMSPSSYQMYEYLNTTEFMPESLYLYKFLETNVEVHSASVVINKSKRTKKDPNKKETSATNETSSYNITKTLNQIFNLIDTDYDGFINFYDFATLAQIGYTFAKLDGNSRGFLIADDLREYYNHYSGYPAMSYVFRQRANRFGELDINTHVDLFSSLTIFRIDDLVGYFKRKTRTENLYEVEIKRILQAINMKFLPDASIQICLRGVDDNNVPLYDWECCFYKGLKANLAYNESMDDYRLAKKSNMTMSHTLFVNVDPNYA